MISVLTKVSEVFGHPIPGAEHSFVAEENLWNKSCEIFEVVPPDSKQIILTAVPAKPL